MWAKHGLPPRSDVAGPIEALYPSCCSGICVSRILKCARSTQLQRKRGQPHLCSFGHNVPNLTQFLYTRRAVINRTARFRSNRTSRRQGGTFSEERRYFVPALVHSTL